MKARGLPVSSPLFASSVDVYLLGPRRPSPPLVPGSSDGAHCSTGKDKLCITLAVSLPDATYIDCAADLEKAAYFLSEVT